MAESHELVPCCPVLSARPNASSRPPRRSCRHLAPLDCPRTALSGQPPARHYAPSARPYPAHLPTLEYPGHFLVKRVTNAGTFRFKHRLHFIANALEQHHIGLEEIDTGIWSLYFGPVLLARLDARDYLIRG